MNWPQLGAILAVRRRNRDAGVKEVVKRRHSPRNRAPADALDAPTMLSTVEGREHSEVVLLKVLGRPPYKRGALGKSIISRSRFLYLSREINDRRPVESFNRRFIR